MEVCSVARLCYQMRSYGRFNYGWITSSNRSSNKECAGFWHFLGTQNRIFGGGWLTSISHASWAVKIGEVGWPSCLPNCWLLALTRLALWHLFDDDVIMPPWNGETITVNFKWRVRFLSLSPNQNSRAATLKLRWCLYENQIDLNSPDYLRNSEMMICPRLMRHWRSPQHCQTIVDLAYVESVPISTYTERNPYCFGCLRGTKHDKTQLRLEAFSWAGRHHRHHHILFAALCALLSSFPQHSFGLWRNERSSWSRSSSNSICLLTHKVLPFTQYRISIHLLKRSSSEKKGLITSFWISITP